MRYVTTLVIGFLVLAGWWLESRFGAMAALAIVGSIVGAGLVIAGLLVGLAHQRTTLQAATTFHNAIAGVDRANLAIDRERARLERSYTEARLRLDQIDARRVDQIAQQRAQLMARPQQARPATWEDWNSWGEEADTNGNNANGAGATWQMIE